MGERILELALAAGGGDRALLEPLCNAAVRAWTARLREGLTAEDCGEAFPCAAAVNAAADRAAGEGGAATISAGDLSVNLGGGQDRARRAEALRQTAERLMEPFVRAAGLWAQGVEG